MGRAKSICVRGLTSLLLVLIAALVLPGCVSSPEHRTGEYFLFTKRQFRLVDEASHANDSHMNPFAVFAPFAMFGGSIIGVTIAPAVDILCIPYDTSMKTHCTVIKVVDEEGDPVPGVNVYLRYSSYFDRVEGRTNDAGEIHPWCDLRVLQLHEYHVSGEGFYTAEWRSGQYCYSKGADVRPEINSDNVLELKTKKVRRPVPMALGRVDIPRMKDGAALDFDCEYADWLPPYGVGRRADLRVGFENADRANLQTDTYTNILSITALGEGNGFLLRKNDIPIRLSSDNRVPADAQFSTNRIEALYVHRKDGSYAPDLSRLFEWRNYYIMRLRSVLNDSGEVVSARYGKMVFMDGMGCLCETYLNEEENEISLEARPGDDNPAYQRSSNEPGYRRGRVKERIGRP